MAETEAITVDAGPRLWEDYRPQAGVYDEMCTAPGELRRHWHGPLRALTAAYGDGLERCYDQVQRLLQDNGVTYNVHGDARDAARPWRVDPVPLLLDGAEWAGVEAGLVQRTRLLDRLLADLYGARSVIRRGLLPPELVYACPDFLRPCYRSLPDDRRWLVFHGIDLARAPDGRFFVLSDRAKAPAGPGYALENRIILQRALPELYRDAPLRRLAGFLEAVRTTLKEMALHNLEQPRVVVLTPGPAARTYFEHAYIANYLSLSLVQGEDLVMRGGRVWLKTLGGLEPVDVILRWVHDDYCDPLELRPDSLLGTAGLLQAARAGGVAVANAIGSGFVENPALLPFLPGLCRRLLDEELCLPSIDTWWCGQPRELDYVLSHLGELDVLSVLPGRKIERGPMLDTAAQAVLRDRIRTMPHLYLGRRPLALSTAPVLEGGRLVPRPLVIRGFVAAHDDDYRVMPGGLARVSCDLANPEVSVRAGGISKDLWVLAPAPEKHVSLLRQGSGPVALTRDGNDLPSRVADNLYWLGRYGERLDATTRLLRETLARLLEQERDDSEDSCLNDLLAALELPIEPAARSSAQARFMAIRGELLGLLTDAGREGSLPQIFAGMLRTGRAVRDHLSDDSWRILNRLQHSLQQFSLNLGAMRERLETHLTLLAAFAGHTNETMPHHQGWVFLDVGRHLERVLNTLDLLNLAFVNAERPGIPLWEVVMTTTDNLTAYRRRYRSELHPTAILDLLLFDEDNPRSVGYQLRRLQTRIERLPRAETPYRSAEERLILKAVSTLQLADIEALTRLADDARAEAALAGLLEALHAPLTELSDAVVHSHFSHAEVPRQLVTMQA